MVFELEVFEAWEEQILEAVGSSGLERWVVEAGQTVVAGQGGEQQQRGQTTRGGGAESQHQ